MSFTLDRERAFSELEDLTIAKVEHFSGKDPYVIFETACGRTFKMCHEEGHECAAHIDLTSTEELGELVGERVVRAYKNCSEDSDTEYLERWTFYHIRTANRSICLTWRCGSTGYYSVTVNFYEVVNGVVGC